MIVFDTNAVNLLNPEGPQADIIRKLRESGHHRVAVPWIVLEEMAAHKARLYPEKHQSAVNVLNKLREVLPWALESSLEPLDLERFLGHWRDTYRDIFEVIDTSGDAACRALAREAMALPPAKRDKNQSAGARDAAIWFSILEFLRQNPQEQVCFVTANTNDFGDGSAYNYPMNEDVRGLEDRLTRLTDFGMVVSHFTTEVSGRDAETAADDLLKSSPIQSRLVQAAVEYLRSPIGFAGTDAFGNAVQWRSWMTLPDAELLSIKDVVGHEIEGDIWYTAEARWLLYGVAADGDGAQNIACVWEVKLLFSASDEDQAPTLLAFGDPSLPDMSDGRCVEALEKLRKRVDGEGLRALANLSAHSSAVGSYWAQQMAANLPRFDFTGIVPSVNVAELMGANLPRFDFTGIVPSVKPKQEDVSGAPEKEGASNSSSDDDAETRDDDQAEPHNDDQVEPKDDEEAEED